MAGEKALMISKPIIIVERCHYDGKELIEYEPRPDINSEDYAALSPEEKAEWHKIDVDEYMQRIAGYSDAYRIQISNL